MLTVAHRTIFSSCMKTKCPSDWTIEGSSVLRPGIDTVQLTQNVCFTYQGKRAISYSSIAIIIGLSGKGLEILNSLRSVSIQITVLLNVVRYGGFNHHCQRTANGRHALSVAQHMRDTASLEWPQVGFIHSPYTKVRHNRPLPCVRRYTMSTQRDKIVMSWKSTNVTERRERIIWKVGAFYTAHTSKCIEGKWSITLNEMYVS